MKYNFAVFIGRFSPFHLGHLNLVLQALTDAEKVIILVGSAHRPPEIRNPWSFEDRKKMILDSFNDENKSNLIVMPLMDSPYNDDLWIQNIQTIVKGVVQSYSTVPHKQQKISLVGFEKDHSSYYLKKFPQWDYTDYGQAVIVDATHIRNKYFSNKEFFTDPSSLDMPLAIGTFEFLAHSYDEEKYNIIFSENEAITEYKKPFKNLPFPPTFNTADAVVICCGHILMVTRNGYPGKGLLALPGGFVDPYETVEAAAIRELKEETKIKVPIPVLKGSIKKRDFFDYPYRSARGRTFTNAFLIELADNSLPKISKGSDAREVHWIQLCDLDPSLIFEDHYAIIQSLLEI
jgi:bifunctional NMN adenylyltransferase/nudix hydrolase